MKPQSLMAYERAWEPLIRMDSAYNAVTDSSSAVLSEVKIKWNVSGSFIGQG